MMTTDGWLRRLPEGLEQPLSKIQPDLAGRQAGISGAILGGGRMSDLSGWSHSNNLRRDELVGDQTVSFERDIVSVQHSCSVSLTRRQPQQATCNLEPHAHVAAAAPQVAAYAEGLMRSTPG